MRALLALLWAAAAASKPSGHADAGTRTDGGSRTVFARPVKIVADKLNIVDTHKVATWTGHVRVKRDATSITCDKMQAHYTQDQEVERILCDGNVEALDGDKRMKGEHADFDNTSGMLVMTPRDAPDGGAARAREHWVEIWHGKTHLWGDKATFWTGEDRLEVIKAHTEINDDHPATKDGGR